MANPRGAYYGSTSGPGLPADQQAFPGFTGRNLAGSTQYLLGQGYGAGFFDPSGSPLIRAQMRRGVLRNARNRRRSGEVLARLAGLGPQEQRQAFVDLERDIGGQTSDALLNADLSELTGAQDFYRNLFGTERGIEFQRAQQKRAARQAQQAMLGSLVGGIGAAGLGAL